VGDERRPPVSPTQTSSAKTASIRALAPSGPQSYTPEAAPKARSRAITQRWAVRAGPSDHRSTIVASGRMLYLAARGGGVVALDAETGAQQGLLPAARGRVVGVALGGDRVYSTSETGQLAAATRAGKVVF